jgi:hypothetical protein
MTETPTATRKRARPRARSEIYHESCWNLPRCRCPGRVGPPQTPWRAKRQISNASEGTDFALTYYSQLVCGILALTPFGCVRAEMSADDIPQLRLYDGSLAEDWATKIQDKSYVRVMADANSEVLGPLTRACKGDVSPSGLQLPLLS